MEVGKFGEWGEGHEGEDRIVHIRRLAMEAEELREK
jgi:hypothetical protein